MKFNQYNLTQIEQDRLNEILSQLISFNSNSAEKKEKEVGDFIFNFFNNLGYSVEKMECAQNRNNVKVIIEGKDHSKSIMYSGHMDCVPGGPFESIIKDGRIYGRGACDMKGSIACIMFMAEYFKQHNIIPDNDVIMVFDIDEEIANLGLKTYLKNADKNVEFIVVGEPTETCLNVGHRGVAAFTVTVNGLSAHVGKASLGINSIYCASEIVQQVIEHNKYLSQNRRGFIGDSSLHVTQIYGGERVNVVPETTVLRLDKRMVMKEDLESSMNELNEIVEKVCKKNNCTFTVESTTYCPPSMLETDNRILKNLQSMTASYGLDSELKAFPATCEAGLLNSNMNVPVVILGPGSIQQAHKNDEYVELMQMYNTTKLYMSFFSTGLSL